MKTQHLFLIIVIILLSLFAIKTATAQVQFNQDEDQYFSTWIDPTFSDRGEQIGITYTMEGDATFAEYSISHYSALRPSYTDITVTYGVVVNFGNLDLYTGARLGAIYREKDNIFALAGLMSRIQYPVVKGKLYLGAQLWFDYRGDLTNDFVRGNTSFYFTYKLN